jgi:hypothetical protein
MTVLFQEKAEAFSVRGSGPQGLRRPRFSFFRFTCQTARKSEDFHTLGCPRADEAKASEPYRWLVPLVNEELQRRAVTPIEERTGAPNDAGYIAHDDPVSTPKTSVFFHPVIPRKSSA